MSNRGVKVVGTLDKKRKVISSRRLPNIGDSAPFLMAAKRPEQKGCQGRPKAVAKAIGAKPGNRWYLASTDPYSPEEEGIPLDKGEGDLCLCQKGSSESIRAKEPENSQRD